MIFEKPSLRTRLSFEVGMTQMGGHAIFYSTKDSPGAKESLADTARVASRMADVIMARVFKHEDVNTLAEYSRVPVINALDDYAHPCQIVADLQTIQEKLGDLPGKKLAYFGDANNNVTHSLMEGCALTGMHIAVACPRGEDYEPLPAVLESTRKMAATRGGSVTVTHDAREAARAAHVLYTDSWMSYHIPKEKEPERVALFKPYQVTEDLLEIADDSCVFMNCLPALRGYEQTAEVIDGQRSIVFDQAENRLHAQKAILLELLDLI
jgi:ornithine carbamoyltransferase